MPAYKDKNNKWYCKFRYKDWTGNTKETTKRGFATKRDAIAWEENFKVRLSGELDMTLADFYEIYKSERYPRLKLVTASTKDYIIKDKILPYFGAKRMREISSTDIMKWQNTLLAFRDKDGEPYSKTYLKTVHNQLSALFNHAVKYYHLSQNPAAIAGNIGNESEIHMKFWTLDEYKKFSYIMMDKPRLYYFFQILYWTGVREGECLALKQSDFDFEKKTLSITKTFQIVQGKQIVTKPKTPKSVREIPLPDFLCEEMHEFFATIPPEMAEERIFYGMDKSMVTRNLVSGAKKAGVKRIRVHDLRHSHVSLLINLGYSAVAIAARVGHESIHVTYKYAHLFPNTQQEMVNKLNELATESSKKGD